MGEDSDCVCVDIQTLLFLRVFIYTHPGVKQCPFSQRQLFLARLYEAATRVDIITILYLAHSSIGCATEFVVERQRQRRDCHGEECVSLSYVCVVLSQQW